MGESTWDVYWINPDTKEPDGLATWNASTRFLQFIEGSYPQLLRLWLATIVCDSIESDLVCNCFAGAHVEGLLSTRDGGAIVVLKIPSLNGTCRVVFLFHPQRPNLLENLLFWKPLREARSTESKEIRTAGLATKAGEKAIAAIRQWASRVEVRQTVGYRNYEEQVGIDTQGLSVYVIAGDTPVVYCIDGGMLSVVSRTNPELSMRSVEIVSLLDAWSCDAQDALTNADILHDKEIALLTKMANHASDLETHEKTWNEMTVLYSRSNEVIDYRVGNEESWRRYTVMARAFQRLCPSMRSKIDELMKGTNLANWNWQISKHRREVLRGTETNVKRFSYQLRPPRW